MSLESQIFDAFQSVVDLQTNELFVEIFATAQEGAVFEQRERLLRRIKPLEVLLEEAKSAGIEQKVIDGMKRHFMDRYKVEIPVSSEIPEWRPAVLYPIYVGKR